MQLCVERNADDVCYFRAALRTGLGARRWRPRKKKKIARQRRRRQRVTRVDVLYAYEIYIVIFTRLYNTHARTLMCIYIKPIRVYKYIYMFIIHSDLNQCFSNRGPWALSVYDKKLTEFWPRRQQEYPLISKAAFDSY